MTTDFIRENLKQKGLKVTPQRIAIFDAVIKLDNHPTAEKVYEYIKSNHPSISLATVYKVLDSLVGYKLLNKVKSDKSGMRYDAIIKSHHHLYCSVSDRIEDYEDEELDNLIKEYFQRRNITNFTIQDIKLQITGKFNK